MYRFVNSLTNIFKAIFLHFEDMTKFLLHTLILMYDCFICENKERYFFVCRLRLDIFNCSLLFIWDCVLLRKLWNYLAYLTFCQVLKLNCVSKTTKKDGLVWEYLIFSTEMSKILNLEFYWNLQCFCNENVFFLYASMHRYLYYLIYLELV